MNVRYRVRLTQYERNELGALLSGGKQAARKLKRAQILLAADAERIRVVLDNLSTHSAGALCCARAASGHAAAPPSIAMKTRRPIILSPRRRARAVSTAR